LPTDAVIEEGIVDHLQRAVPDSLTLLVLPALTIGHGIEHTGCPEILSASAKTLPLRAD
jgi:creatinine amidohydrolase/Fe(II)-dependent formamide hydrolase-like protein